MSSAMLCGQAVPTYTQSATRRSRGRASVAVVPRAAHTSQVDKKAAFGVSLAAAALVLLPTPQASAANWFGPGDRLEDQVAQKQAAFEAQRAKLEQFLAPPVRQLESLSSDAVAQANKATAASAKALKKAAADVAAPVANLAENVNNQ